MTINELIIDLCDWLDQIQSEDELDGTVILSCFNYAVEMNFDARSVNFKNIMEKGIDARCRKIDSIPDFNTKLFEEIFIKLLNEKIRILNNKKL